MMAEVAPSSTAVRKAEPSATGEIAAAEIRASVALAARTPSAAAKKICFA
jgi:hypothetical protein